MHNSVEDISHIGSHVPTEAEPNKVGTDFKGRQRFYILETDLGRFGRWYNLKSLGTEPKPALKFTVTSLTQTAL